MSTYWSLKEDQVLHTCFYGGKTAREASLLLPGRTRNACIGRASRLLFSREKPFIMPKPEPSFPEPPKTFKPAANLAPATFDKQCQHMDAKRCRLTVQPGRLLCERHITKQYLEGFG